MVDPPVVDLSKTFIRCQHCGQRLTCPMNVCPVCDWPRAHSDKTPPPEVGWPDPNTPTVTRPSQAVQPAPYIADVRIEPPVLIPGQSPPSLGHIADLGNIFEQPPVPKPAAILRTLTLAPEDPLPEETEE